MSSATSETFCSPPASSTVERPETVALEHRGISGRGWLEEDGTWVGEIAFEGQTIFGTAEAATEEGLVREFAETVDQLLDAE